METDAQEIEEIFLTPAHREQERKTLNEQINDFFAKGGRVTEGPKLASSVETLTDSQRAKVLECLPSDKRRRIEATKGYKRRQGND